MGYDGDTCFSLGVLGYEIEFLFYFITKLLFLPQDLGDSLPLFNSFITLHFHSSHFNSLVSPSAKPAFHPTDVKHARINSFRGPYYVPIAGWK